MPELITPDGAAVELDDARRAEIDQEFSRAMAPAEPGGIPAPPDRMAPPADEPPKRKRGRPPKSDQARTAAAASASQRSDKDYSEECAGLTKLAWATVAGIPYTTPYAAVIDANEQQLVAAMNAAAQNNARARAAIEKLTAGGGGVWMIQLAAVTVNMSMNALEIMRDPETREAARAATQKKFREFLKAQGVNVPGEEPEDAGVPAAA